MACRVAALREPSPAALDLSPVLKDSSSSFSSSHTTITTTTTTNTITNTRTAAPSTATAASSNGGDPPVLVERNLQHAQNVRLVEAASPESVASQLEQFHISSPKKATFGHREQQKPLSRNPHARLPLDENTFLPPGQPWVAPKTNQPLRCHPEPVPDQLHQLPGAVPAPRPKPTKVDAATASSVVPRQPATRCAVDQQRLEKHAAGDFDYILSVPASSAAAEKYYRESGNFGCIKIASQNPDQSAKLYFGCNLVASTTESGLAEDASVEKISAPVYTLVATPIEDPEQASAETDLDKKQHASPVTVMPEHLVPSPAPEPQVAVAQPGEVATKMLLLRDSSPMRVPSPLPRPMSSARIEDSFEALDELEEQLEAMHEVVRVKRVPSPDKLQRSPIIKASATVTAQQKSPAAGKPLSRAGSVRGNGVELSRSSSLRKSVSTVFGKNEQKPTATNSPSAKRVPTTRQRPASVIEPKQANKPVAPMFELPGDAVARRLKEQRQARLAKAEAEKAEKAAQEMALEKARLARLPTRPTFELPGEAISRRKREEHQAKLRAQEEEERRRREFKARPIRAGLSTPSSVPRETLASRARQAAKAASAAAERCENSAATTSPGRKRPTVGAAASPSRRPLGSVTDNQQQRGRDARTASSAASRNQPAASSIRGTSTSTGSTNISKGSSTVSAEDIQQQRRRAREIYRRDNSLVESRERDQREREMMAKLARQEAAERSRQLSREWAERRQSKRSSVVGPPSSSPSSGKGSAH